MESKLLAVLSSGLRLPVTQVCAELGISRQTFYKYRRRWRVEGPAGLVERSRRPHRSPGQVPVELEAEIVRLRKVLPLDNGAQTIAYHLGRSGWAVPSVATIHRVLVRRGQVVAQPQKRPRSAWRRFEWPAPNSCWQIDATAWVLADGREVWVMDVLDDHSRVLIAARVWPQASGAAAWDAFAHGVAEWGLPAHVLSDNGSCFTGRLFSGGEVDFERTLPRPGRAPDLFESRASPDVRETRTLPSEHQTLARPPTTGAQRRRTPNPARPVATLLQHPTSALFPCRRHPLRTMGGEPSRTARRPDPRPTRRATPTG